MAMGLSETRRQIIQLGDMLVRLGIAVDVTQPVDDAQGANRIRLTWPGGSGLGELVPEGMRGLAYYLGPAAGRCYTCMLFDGALLQMSYTFDGADLASHRLAYLACPCPVGDELAEGEPIADLIEVYAADLSRHVVLGPTLRFDYEPADASDLHAACHVHVVGDQCRIPVMAPLCVGDFVSFVFMHYYPALWREHEFLRDWPRHEFGACLRTAHEPHIHLAWRAAAKAAAKLVQMG